MKTTNYMAIDQYNETYHDLGKFPRKELINRIGGGKVSKIYQDKKDGSVVHTGYVIGKTWLNLYKVEPFEKQIFS